MDWRTRDPDIGVGRYTDFGRGGRLRPLRWTEDFAAALFAENSWVIGPEHLCYLSRTPMLFAPNGRVIQGETPGLLAMDSYVVDHRLA